MHRRILYKDKERNLRVIVPSEKFQQPRESEEEALARLVAGYLPDVAEFIVCRPEDIPTDLTWREAWKFGNINSPIEIDLETCIQIHRTRLKTAASRYIDHLNNDLEMAIKKDDLPSQVAIRRTQYLLSSIHLMNLTHCKTPSDLKFAVPRELHEFWAFYSLKKEQDNDSLSSKNDASH